MGIEDNRREYKYGRLTRSLLSEDPLVQFERWMEQALEAGIQDPTAMSLATVDTQGQPWSRIVLLKAFDHRGFVFYTNLKSRKAIEMEGNGQVCLHFPWLQMDRQVIISGAAQALSQTEVDRYFSGRPAGSQLAAWASQQSRPISSRKVLEQQFAAVKKKFSNAEVPPPEFWGGYRVIPNQIEFWQGGENRLHDRFVYSLSGSDWEIARLSP